MAEDLPEESGLIRYLDDEMSPAERSGFEALLDKDPGLREQLEHLRMAKEAIVYYGIQQQVAQARAHWKPVQAVEETDRGKAKVFSMRQTWRYLIAAASIIIVFMLARGLFTAPLSPEKIYQETFVDYNPGSFRSQQATGSPLERAYQQKNYNGVVLLGRQDSLRAKEQLLLGIAYLKLNDARAAIQRLEALEKRADTTYRQDAAFYAGLAYLKDKQYDRALSMLKKIQADPHHLYHNQISEKTIKNIESLR